MLQGFSDSIRGMFTSLKTERPLDKRCSVTAGELAHESFTGGTFSSLISIFAFANANAGGRDVKDKGNLIPKLVNPVLF